MRDIRDDTTRRIWANGYCYLEGAGPGTLIGFGTLPTKTLRRGCPSLPEGLCHPL